MRQLQSLYGKRPPSVRRQTNQTPGVTRRGGSSGASSPSAVTGVRATCRINGSNFPLVFTSSRQTVPWHRKPRFFVASLSTTSSRTRFAFSRAARALAPLRLLPAPADWCASCQPRASRTPEWVPRSVQKKSQRLRPSAKRRYRGAAWRSRWAGGEGQCFGKLLSNWNVVSILASSGRHFFSLAKLFQSVLGFFFSLQKSGSDPNRPASVPLFYTRLWWWWWWSGGMDIALFPCISTPRGILLLLPTLSYC